MSASRAARVALRAVSRQAPATSRSYSLLARTAVAASQRVASQAPQQVGFHVHSA